MNLTSDTAHWSRGLCFALAFCLIMHGETVLIVTPFDFGSFKIPWFSSLSQTACMRSLHLVLYSGHQILNGGAMLSFLNVNEASYGSFAFV